MLLNQEMLRLVFGIKLRSLRLDRDLSLKELSEKSGLSLSYLNEIENGKKYPKTEKILVLAEALDETHENLISLELKKDFKILQTLLENNVLSAIPFDVFGIPVPVIFQLLAEKPKKLRALIGTLLEIARAHHIAIDDVFHALLRSYLDMHQNYFPAIESAAAAYRQKHPLDYKPTNANLKRELIEKLKRDHGVEVVEKDLTELSPDFAGLLYVPTANGKKVYLSNQIELREQIFILAREIGYAVLKLKARPLTSEAAHLDSFDQLFNHFSAGYFASSLLIPEDEIIQNLRELFAQENWDRARLETILTSYSGTIESVYHRMTQLLPLRFGLKNLFYLRYEFDVPRKKFEIARELHLGHFEGPHRVRLPENYCGRWLVDKLTRAQLYSKSPFQMEIQRSHYHGTQNEYLILGTSFQKPLANGVSSICLGLLVDPALASKIKWLNASEVPRVVVGETCERCAVENCESRKNSLDVSVDPHRADRLQQAIKTLN